MMEKIVTPNTPSLEKAVHLLLFEILLGVGWNFL